jgi:hypothetical protein
MSTHCIAALLLQLTGDVVCPNVDDGAKAILHTKYRAILLVHLSMREPWMIFGHRKLTTLDEYLQNYPLTLQ